MSNTANAKLTAPLTAKAAMREITEIIESDVDRETRGKGDVQAVGFSRGDNDPRCQRRLK